MPCLAALTVDSISERQAIEHAVLAQKPEQLQQRQAEDGGVLAFDALEQVHPAPFQSVGADRGGHRIAFGSQIGVQKGIAEPPHREARLGHMMPQSLPALHTHDRRSQCMGAAT